MIKNVKKLLQGLQVFFQLEQKIWSGSLMTKTHPLASVPHIVLE